MAVTRIYVFKTARVIQIYVTTYALDWMRTIKFCEKSCMREERRGY